MTETVKSLPGGVFAAIPTPMRDDLSVDHALLAEHSRWLLANGCDGLLVLGTTGEANSLSVTERTELLDRLVADDLPAKRLLCGTGCCALPDTVALTRHALANDVGGVLILPPFYYKNVSDDGLYAVYDQLIQQIGDTRLRIFLYHFPQMSGVPISHALIERLVRAYPATVVGMKDSSGDWDNMRTTCERLPGFRVYAGSEQYLLPILRAGGVGCISATTNVTAPLAARVYADWHAPDAEAHQARVNEVRGAIESYSAIPALKFLMAERRGLASWRNMRPPLMPLANEQARELSARLARLRFPISARSTEQS